MIQFTRNELDGYFLNTFFELICGQLQNFSFRYPQMYYLVIYCRIGEGSFDQ